MTALWLHSRCRFQRMRFKTHQKIWSEEKGRLSASGLIRSITTPSDNAVDFSSNDYLGLSSHPQIYLAGCEAAKKLGAGATASRLILQKQELLTELEDSFARWVSGTEALFLNSGYSANIALFDALKTESPQEIFLDHRAHSSLYSACKLSGIKTFLFRHQDYNHLENRLKKSASRFKYIVVESLHSMDGTWENAEALAQLCERYGAHIIVDEAHSIGICGPHGSGWVNANPSLKQYTIAVMYGAGKALGAQGGFVVGVKGFKERLFQKSRTVIYSTGTTPFLVGAVDKAIDLVAGLEGEALREQLQNNIKIYQNLVSNSVSSPIQNYKIADIDKINCLSDSLIKNEFFVRAVRPPTVPRGSSRLRIILHSFNKPSEIENLAAKINEVAQ